LKIIRWPCIFASGKARNFKQRLLTLELQENFSTKLTGMKETASNFEVVKYTKSVDSSQPLNHSSMSTKVSGLWELQLREIEDQSHKTVLSKLLWMI